MDAFYEPTGTVVRRCGPVEYRTWPIFEELGLAVVITTRHGGVSAGPFASLNLGLHVGDDQASVLENRRRAAATLGRSLDQLVVAEQVHGAGVAVVADADRGRGARGLGDVISGVDALVTGDPSPTLMVLVADCVPLVIFDPEARIVACVHAGWRGTVAGAGPSAVKAMASLGADPGRMVAGLGPAIAPSDYEVGPDVIDAVERAFGPVARERLMTQVGDGDHARLDLVSANAVALGQAGIPPKRIFGTAETTGADGPFFSDRAVRPCGRFGLLTRLLS